MKKIENVADVLEWACAIVDANGDKFTPLSKGEQLVIARHILAGAVGTKGSESPDETSREEDSKAHDAAIPSVDSEVKHGDPTTTMQESLTRGEYLHGCGEDAQAAFDQFLDWCKSHPKEKEVMDFSTGTKSVAAAFAYWLGAEVSPLTAIFK